MKCVRALYFNRVPASGKDPLDLAKLYTFILSISKKLVRIKCSPFLF